MRLALRAQKRPGVSDTSQPRSPRRPAATENDRDLWWVRLILNVGRPVVAVIVLVMCAPGEHYLARHAGWSDWLAWGMPGTLTAYAGIAAVVATKRPPGAPGKSTAVWGAVLSILVAMAAQPIAHLYEQRPGVGYRIPLTIIVSCVPALVFGHLLHMAAVRTVAPSGPKVSLIKIPRAPVPREISTPRGPKISLVKKRPAGPIGRLVSHPDALFVANIRQGSKHAPVVYFLRNGSRVKIGFSTDLGTRVKQLALRKTDLLMALHGGKNLELDLHTRFEAQRVGTTEWFELTGELVSYIHDTSGTLGDLVRPTAPKPRPTEPRPAPVKRDTLDVPETPDETQTLLTVAEAAAVASQVRGETVTPSTIRTWKHRGRLAPALDEDGTLFERDAVIAAATKTVKETGA
jgi:hypothetical protein